MKENVYIDPDEKRVVSSNVVSMFFSTLLWAASMFPLEGLESRPERGSSSKFPRRLIVAHVWALPHTEYAAVHQYSFMIDPLL